MSDPTRPIIGIENRTAQEVFDIMCDRLRTALATSKAERDAAHNKAIEKAAEGVKPRVKPLVWDKGFAHTFVGIFYRYVRQSDYVVLEKHDGAMTLKSVHDDIDAAKAAAQADYKARIFSALQEGE